LSIDGKRYTEEGKEGDGGREREEEGEEKMRERRMARAESAKKRAAFGTADFQVELFLFFSTLKYTDV
jgi:hypothetical protein